MYNKNINYNKKEVVTMSIEEQFNLIAKEYDANRKKFIPCFNDYYITTTQMIASQIEEAKRILDLGAGTGLLSYYWYQHYPLAEYVLVDIADEMLDIARKRFKGIDNVSYKVMNYSNEFPDGTFDLITSALSTYHLTDEEKKDLFKTIYDKLPSGGLFVNYDQFCGGQDKINSLFDSYWEKQLSESELTENDIKLWKERRKLDKECSVEEEIKMLKDSNFKVVKCVYTYHKFSVIIAIK